jgi:hypothetical protein
MIQCTPPTRHFMVQASHAQPLAASTRPAWTTFILRRRALHASRLVLAVPQALRAQLLPLLNLRHESNRQAGTRHEAAPDTAEGACSPLQRQVHAQNGTRTYPVGRAQALVRVLVELAAGVVAAALKRAPAAGAQRGWVGGARLEWRAHAPLRGVLPRLANSPQPSPAQPYSCCC